MPHSADNRHLHLRIQIVRTAAELLAMLPVNLHCARHHLVRTARDNIHSVARRELKTSGVDVPYQNGGFGSCCGRTSIGAPLNR